MDWRTVGRKILSVRRWREVHGLDCKTKLFLNLSFISAKAMNSYDNNL